MEDKVIIVNDGRGVAYETTRSNFEDAKEHMRRGGWRMATTEETKDYYADEANTSQSPTSEQPKKNVPSVEKEEPKEEVKKAPKRKIQAEAEASDKADKS